MPHPTFRPSDGSDGSEEDFYQFVSRLRAVADVYLFNHITRVDVLDASVIPAAALCSLLRRKG